MIAHAILILLQLRQQHLLQLRLLQLLLRRLHAVLVYVRRWAPTMTAQRRRHGNRQVRGHVTVTSSCAILLLHQL